jgi:hypothetical protein
MSWHLLAQLEVAVVVSFCAFGMVKGGTPDRLGAFLILLFYMADEIAFVTAGRHFPMSMIFFGDFVLAICLLIVAIRYSSLWLGCAMLLQSVDLCSQGLAFGGDGLDLQSQLWLNNCISLLMVSCVAAGAASTWLKRFIARRDERVKRSEPFSPTPA